MPPARAVASAMLLPLLTFAAIGSGCGQRAAVNENAAPPRLNGEILFTMNGQLYLMRPDGTQLRPIPGSPRDVTDASFSPDGARIAFVRDLGGRCGARLYVMRADGTHVRPLSDPVENPEMEARCYQHPALSPDGRWLAYTVGGPPKILVQSVDSARLRQLPPQSIERWDSNPAWSPDGMTIAFDSSYVFENGGSLWLMDADGKNKRPLGTGSSPSCSAGGEPDWSPDGQWIAFVRECKPPGGGGIEGLSSDIWLTRPDGSGLRRLTHADRRRASTEWPAWSPDGKRIVFTRIVGRSRYFSGSTDIYVMNADGTGQQRLIRLLNDSIAPDWGARQ